MNDVADLVKILDLLLQDLVESQSTLDHSITLCQGIDVSAEKAIPIEDLDKFETLTSRYARISDIVTQKVFRTINQIDLEADGTTRDFINRAAKKGFIEDENAFFEMRELRNRIAHEYAAKSLRNIFVETQKLAPKLSQAIDQIVRVAKEKYETQSN